MHALVTAVLVRVAGFGARAASQCSTRRPTAGKNCTWVTLFLSSQRAGGCRCRGESFGRWMERLRFVARLLDGESMNRLCREFGISRKNGYKIWDRYRQGGDRGAHGPLAPASQMRQPAARTDRALQADGGRPRLIKDSRTAIATNEGAKTKYLRQSRRGSEQSR